MDVLLHQLLESKGQVLGLQGVPRGAVTSPILFNFYLNDIPNQLAAVKLIQYANNISVYTSSRSLVMMCGLVNKNINKLVDFLVEKGPGCPA